MPKTKTKLSASSKVIDPTLDALFASSAGPVAPPTKERYVPLVPKKELEHETKQARRPEPVVDDAEEDDEELSELDEDESMSDVAEEDDDEDEGHEEAKAAAKGKQAVAVADEDEDDEASSEPDSSAENSKQQRKDRKRKRRDEHDDLEGKYMRKLLEEEEKEDRKEKRRKGETGQAVETSESADVAKKEQGSVAEGEGAEETPLVHESLQKPEEHVDVELEKANRTLFLGNVSIEAITSSKAKKTLISHLESPLSELDAASGPHKIESLRFRSTPFSTAGKPKRAAYITKSVMEATARSTNAYAVYTTPLASRAALKALNGTVVLDRHMRVDSVAHPAPVAHRRCVFVGNLGFVDDETVVNTNAEGETTAKKRYKNPSDTEEGLWRVFGEHAGKVESVRVPRDEKTRVGKGFAYVQFYDENDVESALLLNEKKFPPMLPRALRVSRAKDPRKTNLAIERKAKERGDADGGKRKPGGAGSTKYAPKITPEQLSQAGRAARLLGRAAASKKRHELIKGDGGRDGTRRTPRVRVSRDKPTEEGDGIKPPEQFIFEGRRASSRDGKPKDLKFGKKGGGKKGVGKARANAKGRGARRAAEWRKSKTS